MKIKTNKILLKIYLEEEKREKQIEEIWSTLTEQDKLYMENIENFKIWKKNFLQKEIELSAGATNTKNV